jgi:hypothetical protein
MLMQSLKLDIKLIPEKNEPPIFPKMTHFKKRSRIWSNSYPQSDWGSRIMHEEEKEYRLYTPELEQRSIIPAAKRCSQVSDCDLSSQTNEMPFATILKTARPILR